MAPCQFCHRDMSSPNTVSCSKRKGIVYPDGLILPAELYHATALRPIVDIAPEHCRDCGVVHGSVHHLHCCMEWCPRCAWQLGSCECQPVGVRMMSTAEREAAHRHFQPTRKRCATCGHTKRLARFEPDPSGMFHVNNECLLCQRKHPLTA